MAGPLWLRLIISWFPLVSTWAIIAAFWLLNAKRHRKTIDLLTQIRDRLPIEPSSKP